MTHIYLSQKQHFCGFWRGVVFCFVLLFVNFLVSDFFLFFGMFILGQHLTMLRITLAVLRGPYNTKDQTRKCPTHCTILQPLKRQHF